MRRLIIGLLLSFAAGSAAAALPKGLDSAVPRCGEIVAVPGPDSLRALLRSLPLHSIEGIWQWADIDTRVLILRTDVTPGGLPATLYTMTVLHASDPSLRPGTVMAYISTTAKRDSYDARMYTAVNPVDGRPSHPEKFLLELGDDEGRITFKPYGTKITFDWRRLIPYRFRGLLRQQTRSDGDVGGLLRVYPLPRRPHHPVYL